MGESVHLLYDRDDLLEVHDMCATVTKVDTRNLLECIAISRAMRDKYSIGFVYAPRERNQEMAAEISYALGVGGIERGVVNAFRDKVLFRKKLCMSGLDGTRWISPRSISDLDKFASRLPLGMVVKPRFGVGSSGVRLVTEKDQLTFFCERECSELIAEEYLAGDEFSIEVLSRRGEHILMGLTKKYVSGKPYFYEIAHLYPWMMSSKLEELVKSKVFSLLNAFGYADGVSHTEIKIQNNKIGIIESHCRPGGDRISVLIKAAQGIDVFDEHLRALLGKRSAVCSSSSSSGTFASIFFHGSGGRLDRPLGDYIPLGIRVIDYDEKYKMGDDMPVSRSSDTRYGNYVFMSSGQQILDRAIQESNLSCG
jgi:hypothetical protein